MSTWLNVMLHLAPILPVATRSALVLRYPLESQRKPPDQAMQRDVGRNFSLALAGFSFAAVFALIVVAAQGVRLPLELPLYFSFLSFVAFLAAVGLEGHKATVRGDLIADGLREAGVLSLLMGLAVLLYASDFHAFYRYGLPTIGLAAWAWDHGGAWKRNFKDLRARD
jgi:hypothetical protein